MNFSEVKLIFTFCLLIPVVVQAQSTDTVRWTTITQPDFSIQYPSDWALDNSGKMCTQYFFFSPKESDTDLFRDNVNLMVQDLTGYSMDLKAFAALSEDQIKTLMINGQILESGPLKSGNITCHRILFTGDQGTYHLKFEQYYFVRENLAYVLTLTCEIEKFEKFKSTGERILNSFSLQAEPVKE